MIKFQQQLEKFDHCYKRGGLSFISENRENTDINFRVNFIQRDQSYKLEEYHIVSVSSEQQTESSCKDILFFIPYNGGKLLMDFSHLAYTPK